MAVAATTAAASTGATQKLKRSITEGDHTIGEVLSEVTNTTLCFVGLPQEEIVRILHNILKPIILCRLSHMRGLTRYLL